MDDELAPSEGKAQHFIWGRFAEAERQIASALRDGEACRADSGINLELLWGKSQSLQRSRPIIEHLFDLATLSLAAGPNLQTLVHASLGSGKTGNYLALLRESRVTLRKAGNKLKEAGTRAERCVAAREFLAALADLLLCLLQFIVQAVLMLLSQLMGRSNVLPVAMWKPEPTDIFPRVTPRGPNPALPVITYRGGHHRSSLGSVVLAA